MTSGKNIYLWPTTVYIIIAPQSVFHEVCGIHASSQRFSHPDVQLERERESHHYCNKTKRIKIMMYDNEVSLSVHLTIVTMTDSLI